jgi:hypothetical protein
MIRFFLASAAGWLAVLLVGVEIAIPYWLRPPLPGIVGAGPERRVRAQRERMRPHYWLGYLVASLALAHASVCMGPILRGADATGLWAAAVGLGLLFLQVGIGVCLQTATGTHLRALRGLHFWTMLTLVPLLLAHWWRNA